MLCELVSLGQAFQCFSVYCPSTTCDFHASCFIVPPWDAFTYLLKDARFEKITHFSSRFSHSIFTDDNSVNCNIENLCKASSLNPEFPWTLFYCQLSLAHLLWVHLIQLPSYTLRQFSFRFECLENLYTPLVFRYNILFPFVGNCASIGWTGIDGPRVNHCSCSYEFRSSWNSLCGTWDGGGSTELFVNFFS